MTDGRKKITLDLNGLSSNEKNEIKEAFNDGGMIGGVDSDEIEMTQRQDTEIEMNEESENNLIDLNVSMPDKTLPDVKILDMERISSNIKDDGSSELDEILKKKSSDLNSEDIMTLRLFILKNGSSNEKVKLALAKSKIEEKIKIQREETELILRQKDKELEEELGLNDEGDIDNLDDLYDIEDEEDIEIEKEKINKLKEEYPLNVWDLIDTYFRDNRYYKSKHQLDSFDEFISSKTNGIEYIIKRENPLRIFKENMSDGGFQYEITIYFGETLNENGNIIYKNEDNTSIKNIYITSPTIYNTTTNKMSYMYPNDARLKSLTYSMYIFCNIGVIIKDNKNNTRYVKNYNEMNIGNIPIMLHSKSCILNGLNSQKLTEFGECPYDQGGYFIIKGKEKVVISQEKKVNNILYINKSPDDNIILQGIIKSVSKEGFQSSRTNAISLVKKNISGFMEKSQYRNVFTVRILGLDTKIPLFILFRALGIETDKNILDMIIYDSDSDLLKNKLLEELLSTIKDSQPIYTQKNAYKFISLNTKGKQIINVIDIINNNFLPNYETDNLSKAKYLAYSVRKIILTHIKVLKETDRDSYSNKRIDTVGPLLLELYRELWGNYQRNVSLKIDTEYKFNFEKIGTINNIINKDNITSIFDNRIMDDIVKSFGSIFGTGISGKQGIVQDLNRNSMLGTLSHIRRISTPLPSGSKTIGPRKLHNTQWGFICPTESPDGGNVGIINHLTIISNISFNILENPYNPDNKYGGIMEALIDLELLKLEDSVYLDLNNYSKVFLNGKWIGLHKKPDYLIKIMKLYKLNSIININTSISWNIDNNEVYIFSDSGRLLRPVLVLKYGKDNKKYNDLINGDIKLMESWDKCIHGYLFNKIKDLSVYSNKFYKKELLEIKSNNENYIKFLEDNSAPIEFLDPTESEYSLISRDIYSIDRNYTHCEIHSSLILSPLALQIPFPEHSQYPRNVFSCQQTKQAVGVYSSSYNNRFDTFSHVLNYPQKPLVTTKYNKYTNVDNLPNGINIVVAIASYLGYNQEDGIMINKSSVERGMFRSMYFRSYEDNEETNNNSTSSFANPSFVKDIIIKNTNNYSKLDDNGIIKEGEFVTSNDVITSKVVKYNLPDGTEVNNIVGNKISFGTSGYTDKIIVTKNKENLKKCKVRIFKSKIPSVGDKYASRCGQKGMCGVLLDQWELPFTKDGIVPDLVINPHAIPSRMTINQLLEVVLGKASCIGGYYGDATPFQNNNIKEFGKLLETFNYEKNANEVMYSGITGEQLKTSIFIGPTYYQRLKIMVADKMFSRAQGKMQSLIRQPAAGRANGGGLRIGEMERDSILGYGAAYFLNESMMERSDKFQVQINKNDGMISYSNLDENDKILVNMPYAMKMLLQELETLSVAPRLVTPSSIDNIKIFEHNIDLYTSNNGIDPNFIDNNNNPDEDFIEN
jgi:DNA-directed RNA polymerase II subunit RPB2